MQREVMRTGFTFQRRPFALQQEARKPQSKFETESARTGIELRKARADAFRMLQELVRTM